MTPQDPRHATPAGYSQHRRDGEDACQPCKTAATSRAAIQRETEPVALTGGRWVNVRGIMRWEVDPAAVSADELATLRRTMRSRKPQPANGADLVACPKCLARLSETCKTSGGNPANPHRERVASRRCSCGDLLAPYRHYCDPCRDRARKETYRRREIRKATAGRRRGEVAA